MTLVPRFFDDFALRPSRIFDRRFDDFFLDDWDLLCPFPRCFNKNFYRTWKSLIDECDFHPKVKYGKDKFQVNVDVQKFNPDEINVKVSGNNTITIEGKHEEKKDKKRGYVSRRFVGRYYLPEGHDLDNVVSNLSSDGVLSVTAPRIVSVKDEERRIPIVQTGVPSKAIEGKNKDRHKKCYV